MATVKNAYNLESLLELTRRGVALDLDAAQAAGITPASDLEDLLSNPGILIPSVLANEVPDSDIFMEQDFLFCDPKNPLDIARQPEDECLKCQKNPNAFVPDWRSQENFSSYVDGKNCSYNIVVDTVKVGTLLTYFDVDTPRDLITRVFDEENPKDKEEFDKIKISNIAGLVEIVNEIPEQTQPVYNIPKGEELEYFITAGIKSLLEQNNKAEEITAIIYVPKTGGIVDNNKLEVETPEDRRQRRKDRNKKVLSFLAELVAGKATSPFTLLGSKGKQPGYQRVAQEYDTVKELVAVAIKEYNSNPSQFVFCPITAGMPTKILVKIPQEIFDKVPQKLQAVPDIEKELETYNTPFEVTLVYNDFITSFTEVAKHIRRAKRYVDSESFDVSDPKFFRADAPPDAPPVAIDFNSLASKLVEFKKTYLGEAIKATGMKIKDVQKVIINIDRNEETKALSIKQVTFNKAGCPDIRLNDAEIENGTNHRLPAVKRLLGYSNSYVLGYVAAIPDIMAYVRGQRQIVWPEFLARFTYPGLVFRNPEDLMLMQNKNEDLKCIAEKSLTGLVNSLLGQLNTLPNMFYGALKNSTCTKPGNDLQEFNKLNEVRRKAVEELLRKLNNLNPSIAQNIANSVVKIRSEDPAKIDIRSENITLERSDTINQAVVEASKSLSLGDNPTAQESKNYELQKKYLQEIVKVLEQEYNVTTKGTKKAKALNPAKDALGMESQITRNMKEKANTAIEQAADRPMLQILLNLIFGTTLLGRDLTPPGSFIEGIDNESKAIELIKYLNKGGGWCTWAELILSAGQCILKGLDAQDAKSALAKAILSKLTPFEFQKLFRNMPPEIRERIRNSLATSIPGLLCGLFPWECDKYDGSQTFSDGTREEAGYRSITKNPTILPAYTFDDSGLSQKKFIFHFDINKTNVNDTNSTDIDNSIKQALDMFTENIANKFNTDPVKQKAKDLAIKSVVVNIVGHASTTASKSHNQTLSENRAKEIDKRVKQLIPGVQTAISAKGENEPIVKGPPGTPDGQVKDNYEDQANRRVEISFKVDLAELSKFGEQTRKEGQRALDQAWAKTEQDKINSEQKTEQERLDQKPSSLTFEQLREEYKNTKKNEKLNKGTTEVAKKTDSDVDAGAEASAGGGTATKTGYTSEDYKNEIRERRQELVAARINDGYGQKFFSSLGQLQQDVTQIFIDTLMQAVGIDQLLDFLEDVPGVGFARKAIKDFSCMLPAIPKFDPGLDSFLKEGRADFCLIGTKGWISVRKPMMDPPMKPKGKKKADGTQITKEETKVSKEEIKEGKRNDRREKNAIIRKKINEFLVDMVSTAIISLVRTVLESLLDGVCNLVAGLAANIAELASGNRTLRDKLKQSLCPGNISDEDFLASLKRIVDAMYNNNPDTAQCSQALTQEEFNNYFNSLMVVLTYGQIYNLLLGQADANTLAISVRIAETSNNPNISCLFSSPDNIDDFFRGLGTLVNARQVIDAIPPGYETSFSQGFCPPQTKEQLDAFRRGLLSDKGLSPTEIEDQLNKLKEAAQQKLQDIIDLSESGPFTEIPDIFPTDECKPAVLNPPQDQFTDLIQSVFKPIENKLFHDLAGHGRGSLMNNLLADSFGRGDSEHKFMNFFFGNNIGQSNVDFEFYSNNTLKKSIITIDASGEAILELVKNKKSRIDQFGRTMPDSVDSFVGPAGGYPPTVGAYLMKKYQENNIGFFDVKSFTGNYNPLVLRDNKPVFKTRRINANEVFEREQAIEFNNEIAAFRREVISKWALAIGFIDAAAAQPYIKEELTYSTINHTKEVYDLNLRNPKYIEREALFNQMLKACSKDIKIEDVDDEVVKLPKPANYSPELRIKKILGKIPSELKEISINGRLFGMSLATRNKMKNIFDSRIPAGDTINLSGIERRVSLQMARFYLEVWHMFGGNNPDEEFSEATIRTIQGIECGPSTNFRRVPSLNPYELAFTYLAYQKPIGISGKSRAMAKPEWGFHLTYDFNIEDNDGNLIPEKQNTYRVVLTEMLDPFEDGKLSRADKQLLREQYKETLDAASSGDASVQESLGQPIYGSTTEFVKFDAEINSIPEEDVSQYISLVNSNTANASNIPPAFSLESEYFTRYLANRVISDTQIPQIAQRSLYTFEAKEDVNKLFDFINEGFTRRISHRIGFGDGKDVVEEFDNLDPNTPEGQGIKTIVPEGWRYGYDPLEVPQVVILDPLQYGGSDQYPPFYLQPPKFRGWLGVVQLVVPPYDACEPRNIPLNTMNPIKRTVQQISNKLKQDERLNNDPFCTQEAPYDGVSETGDIAILDAVIRATCRVYSMDVMLRMVPIVREFKMDLKNNFDELMSAYIADHTLAMIKRVDQKRVVRPRGPIVAKDNNGNLVVTGENEVRLTYYFGFLEQVVTNVLRKIDSGIIDETKLLPSQRESLNVIRQEILNYYTEYKSTEAVLSEEAIAAQNLINRIFNASALKNAGVTTGPSPTFNKLRAKRIKKALNYEVLKKTEKHAINLLRIYTQEEFERLAEIINVKFEPNVESLDLLFLGSKYFINGAAEIERDPYSGEIVSSSGPYDVSADPTDPSKFNIDFKKFTDENIEFEGTEVRLETPGYDPNTILPPCSDIPIGFQNPGQNCSDSPTQAPGKPIETVVQTGGGKRWPFVLEKFIITEDKSYDLFEGNEELAERILDRDARLKGAININSWYDYIQGLVNDPTVLLSGNISDFWGSKQVKKDEITGKESIISGWKFGLRLSLAFAEDDEYAEVFSDIANNIPATVITKTKSYRVASPEGNRIIFPLVEVTLDIKDQLINLFSPEQYDLPCLINEMRKSVEFRSLFRYVFPYRRYLSLLSIYSVNSFYDSIGNAGPPSQGGDRWYIPGGKKGTGFRGWDKEYVFMNKGNLLGNTSGCLMNTFMALYREKNQLREETGNEFKINMPQWLSPFDLGSLIPPEVLENMPWAQRRNEVERPLDMFDNECGLGANEDDDDE